MCTHFNSIWEASVPFSNFYWIILTTNLYSSQYIQFNTRLMECFSEQPISLKESERANLHLRKRHPIIYRADGANNEEFIRKLSTCIVISMLWCEDKARPIDFLLLRGLRWLQNESPTETWQPNKEEKLPRPHYIALIVVHDRWPNEPDQRPADHRQCVF